MASLWSLSPTANKLVPQFPLFRVVLSTAELVCTNWPSHEAHASPKYPRESLDTSDACATDNEAKRKADIDAAAAATAPAAVGPRKRRRP